MPSCVWCDRAPYRVKQSPSEVVERIEESTGKFAVVFFDLADQVAKPKGDRIALAVAHISAVEDSPDPVQGRSQLVPRDS